MIAFKCTKVNDIAALLGVSPQNLNGYLDKALARAAKKAGITKDITPHLLRHSIATHMLAKGINLRTIQAMLGHAQVATTEWYTHVVTDDIRDATKDLFAEMRRGKRKKVGVKKTLTQR